MEKALTARGCVFHFPSHLEMNEKKDFKITPDDV